MIKPTVSPCPSRQDHPVKLPKWWLPALLGLWMLLGLLPLYLSRWLPLTQEAQQFADMFGMVNSLFSGLAFLGLIHTIRLQKDELALQREELGRSTAAQRDSARALALQVIISGITCQINVLQNRLNNSFEHAREQRRLAPSLPSFGGSDNRRLETEISALTARLVGYDMELSAILRNTDKEVS